MDYTKYQKYFTASKMWDKIAKVASKAGIKIIYLVLLLYYTAIDSETSLKDKAIIFGVLGYFILPVDLVPDGIPLVGYSDDLAALIAAYNAVKGNITPAVKARAREKLHKWFKTFDEAELNLD